MKLKVSIVISFPGKEMHFSLNYVKWIIHFDEESEDGIEEKTKIGRSYHERVWWIPLKSELSSQRLEYWERSYHLSRIDWIERVRQYWYSIDRGLQRIAEEVHLLSQDLGNKFLSSSPKACNRQYLYLIPRTCHDGQ